MQTCWSAGAFGTVYKGWYDEVDAVAIKMMLPGLCTPSIREAFVNEVGRGRFSSPPVKAAAAWRASAMFSGHAYGRQQGMLACKS